MSTTLNTAAIPFDDPRRNLADCEIVNPMRFGEYL